LTLLWNQTFSFKRGKGLEKRRAFTKALVFSSVVIQGSFLGHDKWESVGGEYKLYQSATQKQGGIGNETTPKRQPFRLSIFTQFYPPDYAATGQLIEELATQLKDQGLHVHVFTGQPGYAFQKKSAPSIEQKGRLLIRRSRAARLWPKRIRGKAINGVLFCLRSGFHLLKSCWRGDVLLLTTAPPFLPLLGYLAHLTFKLPYVCLLYDLYPDVAVELQVVSPHHWLVRCWNLINQEIWKNAKGIIVLSPSMEKRILAKCPEVADKIAVIHSWANPDWIVPLPKQDNWFAHKHNLVEKFTVLYSGNMGRCHDMDTILEAATLLQNEPIQFVFIGDGAKRQACMEQVETLGLNNCLFLPYQDKQYLPYSLTACDLSLVSISPGMEGLVAPSKFYGILAAGRPVAVVCEQHSYLRQLVKEADCGEAFQNGDGVGLADYIRRLADDTESAHQMGKAGRHYLKSNFTLEIIANQYSQIFSQALVKNLKPKGVIAIEQAQ
jgi:glycosyltransferase involved in cell wall biosynthesis